MRKTMCMVIVISLVIALATYFYPLNFKAYCSPPYYIPYCDSDCVVNAGDSVDWHFTIYPMEIGTITTEVYGDIVQLEKWNATLNSPTALRLFEENIRSLTLDVPLNACTTEYGLIFQWLWKGVVTHRVEVFVNVTNGLPYEYSRTRYNYTGLITGDDMYRDLYLPMRRFPVTAWFKVEEYGIYYLDTYLQFGAEVNGLLSARKSMLPGVEYNQSFDWSAGPAGAIGNYIVRIMNESHILEEHNITVVLHCPGGEDSPPPIAETVFTVTVVSDVNGDLRVDMRDIGICCNCYMFTPESPEWNPNADINKDEVVDMRDIGIACAGFGMHV